MLFNKPVRAIDFSKPFVVLNFKTYKESAGNNALRLAQIAEKVQKTTKINIIVCVNHIDLKEVCSKVKIPVFAQHIDNKEAGKSTGSVIVEDLLGDNVKGSLLNHSEKKIPVKDITSVVTKLKEYNMISIVCASNYTEAKQIAKIKPIVPTLIAVEPPELIGGEKSVSQSKPEVIPRSVKACGNIPVLVGAGIKSNEDLKIALQHGAKGVLLASHFVLSNDPEKFLKDLIKDI
ncbi:MAG TPA: triose-phosphate isomerase [Alphaproteobacteria bacterium]|nr:triose-phosphate isomerase [Alphaproteobacteria bacterium]